MEKKTYCAICSIVVAPFDAKAIRKNGVAVHQHCLERVELQTAQPLQLEIVWDGQTPLTYHPV